MDILFFLINFFIIDINKVVLNIVDVIRDFLYMYIYIIVVLVNKRIKI